MSEWISVENRLPEIKVNGYYYCLVSKKNGVVFEAVYDIKLKKWRTVNYDLIEMKITHWQPLPYPPKINT